MPNSRMSVSVALTSFCSKRVRYVRRSRRRNGVIPARCRKTEEGEGRFSFLISEEEEEEEEEEDDEDDDN